LSTENPSRDVCNHSFTPLTKYKKLLKTNNNLVTDSSRISPGKPLLVADWEKTLRKSPEDNEQPPARHGSVIRRLKAANQRLKLKNALLENQLLKMDNKGMAMTGYTNQTVNKITERVYFMLNREKK